MATCTHRVGTASSTDGATFTSGSFTPAVGDLLVVFVTASDTVLALPKLTGTGAGQFFTLVTSATKRTSLDTTYCFVGTQLITSASSQTVTFDCTGDSATGAVIQVFSVSGMTRTGYSAIRQFKTVNNNAAGTPAPAFTNSVLTGNPTAGVISNATNAATMTTPSGWTERNDTGYATPTTGAEYVTRDSGFTGTTVTWGSSSASAYCAIIIELDTSAAPAKVATLTDTFSSTLDTGLWTNGGSASVSGGVASFPANGYGSAQSIYSNAAYDLTSSELVIDVSAIPSTFNGGEVFFTIELYDGTTQGPTYHYIRWFYYGTGAGTGNWIVVYRNTGSEAQPDSVAYSASTRFLRIKHTSGNIVWSYSADGASWTDLETVALSAVGVPLTGLRVALRAGAGAANTGSFDISAVNPVGAVTHNALAALMVTSTQAAASEGATGATRTATVALAATSTVVHEATAALATTATGVSAGVRTQSAVSALTVTEAGAALGAAEHPAAGSLTVTNTRAAAGLGDYSGAAASTVSAALVAGPDVTHSALAALAPAAALAVSELVEHLGLAGLPLSAVPVAEGLLEHVAAADLPASIITESVAELIESAFNASAELELHAALAADGVRSVDDVPSAAIGADLAAAALADRPATGSADVTVAIAASAEVVHAATGALVVTDAVVSGAVCSRQSNAALVVSAVRQSVSWVRRPVAVSKQIAAGLSATAERGRSAEAASVVSAALAAEVEVVHAAVAQLLVLADVDVVSWKYATAEASLNVTAVLTAFAPVDLSTPASVFLDLVVDTGGLDAVATDDGALVVTYDGALDVTVSTPVQV